MPVELVLRIGPRESPLRLDRQPVVAEASEIERLGYAGWLPAQQEPLQAERLRVQPPLVASVQIPGVPADGCDAAD